MYVSNQILFLNSRQDDQRSPSNTSETSSVIPQSTTFHSVNSPLNSPYHIQEPSMDCDEDLDIELEDVDMNENNEMLSHQSRLQRIRNDMADPISDDVHDLVTPEEFMHAMGMIFDIFRNSY